MKLSDLITQRKPTMEEILIEAIHDTIEIDKMKPNDDVDMIKHENDTFYYRAIYLFLKNVSKYYSSDEVEKWLQKNILKVDILPPID